MPHGMHQCAGSKTLLHSDSAKFESGSCSLLCKVQFSETPAETSDARPKLYNRCISFAAGII